jgi:uncharacterized protein YggE
VTRSLVVTGEGAASGTADHCLITLALNVMAATSADALDQVGALAEQFLEVVLAQGVARSDVQTLRISLQDWLDKDSRTEWTRVATYMLLVRVTGLEKVGPLLAEVAPIAGDSLQVQGIRLAMGDPKPVLAEARRAAVEDALTKARELAQAAGVQLGKITSIDEADTGRSGNRRLMSAHAAAMPVEPGTSEVTAGVTITFEIDD